MKGDSSIGLTTAESENGLLTVDVAGGSEGAPTARDRYGGGAVAVESDRGMGSATTLEAMFERAGLGGVACLIASR